MSDGERKGKSEGRGKRLGGVLDNVIYSFCMQNAKIGHSFLGSLKICETKTGVMPLFTMLIFYPISDLYCLVVFNTVFVSKI